MSRHVTIEILWLVLLIAELSVHGLITVPKRCAKKCKYNHCEEKTFRAIDPVTNKRSLTCELCAPGTHLVEQCTENSSTICSPCADGHYMTFWNQCEQCQYCSTYCTSRYEVVENECSPTQKRTCVCKRGYYKTGDLCRPHTKCPPGSGVSRNGTSTRDVKCGKCRKGSYSDVYDSVSRCQPHTNCTAYNMVVGHPGNGTFDVTCSSNVIEVEPISDRKAKRLQKRKLREEKRNQRKMKRKDRKERRGRKRSKLASN